MMAMVFAAGTGTRLRPLTDKLPKALVEVGGVPMLERVICRLRDAGLGPVVVNVCYLAPLVRRFVESKDFGVKVLLSDESAFQEPLETGGGIKFAAPLLEGRVLLHNSDILSDADLCAFIESDDPASLATLLVNDRPSDRYLLFDREMRLVGWTNVLTGEVRSPYPGLDAGGCLRYAFCGIHIIASGRVAEMTAVDWPERFGIMDFYLSSCRDNLIRGVVANGLSIIDIGSPEALAAANCAIGCLP